MIPSWGTRTCRAEQRPSQHKSTCKGVSFSTVTDWLSKKKISKITNTFRLVYNMRCKNIRNVHDCETKFQASSQCHCASHSSKGRMFGLEILAKHGDGWVRWVTLSPLELELRHEWIHKCSCMLKWTCLCRSFRREQGPSQTREGFSSFVNYLLLFTKNLSKHK